MLRREPKGGQPCPGGRGEPLCLVKFLECPFPIGIAVTFLAGRISIARGIVNQLPQFKIWARRGRLSWVGLGLQLDSRV